MISEDRLVRTFIDLARIESLSLNEKACAAAIKEMLVSIGMRVRTDNAHKKIGGNTGNLYGYLKGTRPGRPLLFSAHMDTVGPAANIKPVRQGGYVVSKGATVLGADDKGGVAIILEMLRALKEDDELYPDIEVLFTVAEEIGLQGAKNIEPKYLKARTAFIFDSEGGAGAATSGSPFYNGVNCQVFGRTAHAGVEPEKGRSALLAAAEMVTRFKQGRLDKRTTANIGIFRSGGAKNIVADEAYFEGEIRSHDLKTLERHTKALRETVRTVAKKHGVKVELDVSREFNGFAMNEKDPDVRRLMEIMRGLRLRPKLAQSGGGSDANVLNSFGIRAFNLATGTKGLHTTEESLSIKDAVASAKLALKIATSF